MSTTQTARPRVTVPPRSCPDCEGDGRRWNPAADRFDAAACPTCKGEGYDPRDRSPVQDSERPGRALLAVDSVAPWPGERAAWAAMYGDDDAD